MNLVDQRGIAGVNFPKMAPGEVKSSAVLYDTVSTGVEDLTLTLPDSNISTLHIVAGGEERIAFKLSSLVDPRRNSELAAAKNVEFKGGRPCPDGVLWYRRLHEITLPGARHSDIGGSYPDGGIRALSAYLCRRFQSTLGLPIRADRPDLDAVQAMHAHDSRIVTMERSHEIRQNAWREMASLPASSWDGTYSEHCTGSFIPSNHGRSEGMRIVRSAPSDQARGVSEGDLGGHLSVTWRLVPCPDGQRPRVVVEGCRDFTFNDLGELMYRDARILSGPTRDEVAAELNRAKIAHLNVSFEKAISPRPHDAKQSVSDSSMERAPDRDRWQRNVESAVRAANEHGSYMPVEGAEALVRDAVENATMVLRERFPEVRGVAVRIRPSSEHGGDSVIAVTCARRPGADFTQSKDLLCGFDDVGQADLPLAEFVQTVRAGLRSIVKSLAEQSGMPTPRGAFEFGHVSLPAGRLGAPTVGLSVLVARPLGASDAVTGDRDDHSSGERCQHLRVVR